MQCAEFESRLNDLLDQRRWLDADRHLADHVRRCNECRNLAAAYEAVVVGLEQSRVPQPDPALTVRIMTDFAADFRPLPVRGRASRVLINPSRLGMIAALAATVLLAVALRWALAPAAANRAQGDRATAANEQRRGAGEQQGEAPVNVPDSERIAKGADIYRGLAAETSQSFSVAMQLFPGVGGDPKEGAERTANDPASDWMHGLSDGLKPVTRPTAGAVNSFLQLLAAGDGGARS